MTVKINTDICSEALIKLYIGYPNTTSSDRYKVVLSNMYLKYDREINDALNIGANYFDPAGKIHNLFEGNLSKSLIVNPNEIDFEQIYKQSADQIEDNLADYISQNLLDYNVIKKKLLENREKQTSFDKYSNNLSKLKL